MKIVIIGLSITSSWGNGHATTYRGLMRELVRRGHKVLFLERDQPWYADNRDMPQPPFGRSEIYEIVPELKRRFADEIATADCVIVGSYIPEGKVIGEWLTNFGSGVTAFYDIDTPITLQKIAHGDCDYLSADLIARYDLYLSFTGGPTLDLIEQNTARPWRVPYFVRLILTNIFRNAAGKNGCWDISAHSVKIGNASSIRSCSRRRLCCHPGNLSWPDRNTRRKFAGRQTLHRITHLSPAKHRAFYNSQNFTLNITRAAMVRAGFSPSVRLFEAAACGTPIISDDWPGLRTLFRSREEILIASDAREVMEILHEMPGHVAREIGLRGRERVLRQHTSAHRALELERFISAASGTHPRRQSWLRSSSKKRSIL